VLVHAHQSRNHGSAAEVHRLRAGGHGRGARRSDGRDLAMIDENGLILDGRGPGAIDHAHMLQRDDGGVDGNKGLCAGSEAALSERGGAE
jgi:hypothetical protein